MSDSEAFLLSFACCAVIYLVWYYVFERLPLEKLGWERVRRILAAEPAWRRERILTRGWVTRDEWLTIRVRQLRGDACQPRPDRERP